ncbi:hypothetical protein QYG89_10785 [Bacillus sp. B190/17]|uniref:YtxH domain-containing protein n=1 Tax=Bacillus lumedeiriae TaxID=3058829 RepID=A0ABW8IAY9_9BACI
MGKGKFFAKAAIGAVIGGAIALTDRQTRAEMKEWAVYLFDMLKDPEKLSASSKEIINQAREMVQKATEDVNFIYEKVDSLKELTPSVKELVDETKTTFLPHEEDTSSAAGQTSTK